MTTSANGNTASNQPSPLIANALQSLSTINFEALKQEGIYRSRAGYFLNIAYPSLQIMETVEPKQIFAPLFPQEKSSKNVALYVHVPFCQANCSYCHYYKEFNRSASYVDAYLEGVDKELALYNKKLGALTAASVYIGGGTPSYLEPRQIQTLFKIIRSHVTVPKDIEISFEIHPEKSDDQRLEAIFRAGVNRINIGVESFDDTILQNEARRHTASDVIALYSKASEIGFKNINLDLIYGLKGQTLENWQYSLDKIAELKPASTTMYYLRIKRGTAEFQQWVSENGRFPSEEDVLVMHAMNVEKMEKELGYAQTPVDWFIRDNTFTHTYQDHNWRKTDDTELLGIGPSAYSYVGGWQYYNRNDTSSWKASLDQGQLPLWKGEYLSQEERMRRSIMLGLKLGIDRADFKNTYEQDPVAAFKDTWESLCKSGAVKIDAKRIDLTYAGKLFADEVGQKFYSRNILERMRKIDPALVSTTWPTLNK